MPGVYIAAPFCAQKCTYCNFASDVQPPGLLPRYAAALAAEIAGEAWTFQPETLYVGGGTPSLLPPDAWQRICGPLPVSAWREATLEASPGTVTSGRVRLWRSLGINRVSLGVQSFVAREIAATGRKHTADQAAGEIALLRAEGITNISIDLIAGLAWQTPESWRESLDWIARLGPPHVSVYMLEADEDSRLGRELLRGGGRYGAAAVPPEDAVADMYEFAVERLAELGLARYEISNFARPGFESAHNLKYWRLEPYRGFGAGAHSFDGARRWSNVETAAEYVARFEAGEPPAAWTEPADPGRERFFVGLRQSAGIEPTGDEWSLFAEPIRRLAADGLVERAGTWLRLTPRGVLLSNLVFQEFLP